MSTINNTGNQICNFTSSWPVRDTLNDGEYIDEEYEEETDEYDIYE